MNKFVYECDNYTDEYRIIIEHRFPSVNTSIDSFSYYLTLNNDKVSFCDESVFIPEFVRTDLLEDGNYESEYVIKPDFERIGKKEKDTLKINLIFPFDRKINIFNWGLKK